MTYIIAKQDERGRDTGYLQIGYRTGKYWTDDTREYWTMDEGKRWTGGKNLAEYIAKDFRRFGVNRVVVRCVPGASRERI